MTVEAWLRGSIPGVPPLLMPVAHAITQSKEELRAVTQGLTAAQLWERPGGAAAVGFHLRHIPGSADRLLTYALGRSLTEDQLAALADEREPIAATAADLLDDVDAVLDRVLHEVRRTPEERLLEPRHVGRARLPSTVLGLLFHIAEHTQRHTGQVIATAKFVRTRSEPGTSPPGRSG
ncbi:MAG TPA: DinB family protein [Longimicrobiales bacterium]